MLFLHLTLKGKVDQVYYLKKATGVGKEVLLQVVQGGKVLLLLGGRVNHLKPMRLSGKEQHF